MSGEPAFTYRAETFGFDRDHPWALDVLRLLFNVPRAYQPLVDAWLSVYPGSRKALHQLVESGFVSVQDPVIVDTATGRVANGVGMPLRRYCTTSRGRRLVLASREDLRVISDRFPRISDHNLFAVSRLLELCNVDDAHRHVGVSGKAAVAASGLAERSGRWWLTQLRDRGYVRELADRVPDVREIVPRHWRVTRPLARQLKHVFAAFPEPHGALASEFRLDRSRFLTDIQPSRVSLSGATDYDHDVNAQRVLAALVRSPIRLPGGRFLIEPRFTLPVDEQPRIPRFDVSGAVDVFWQPDGLFTSRHSRGVTINAVEYERHQSRRDAWGHIERFLGYLQLRTMPFEAAVLRFVLDSRARVRGYVALIEAFADYVLDHPERLPANPVVLACSDIDTLTRARDPLADDVWFRVELEPGEVEQRQTVLHYTDTSPYDLYFSRKR